MAATAQPIDTTVHWDEAVDQPSLIVNENFLRLEVLLAAALSFEATQPGSPSEGGLYILSAAWGDEVIGTLAYYRDGAWSYWTPVSGMIKRVGATDYYMFDSDGSGIWEVFGGGGGGAVDSVNGRTGAVVLTAADVPATSNVQIGTSYTLVLADAGKLVGMDNASANSLTVPANASVPYPVDTRIDVTQDGLGQTTIVEDTDVVVRTRKTLKLEGQYAKATLIKRATNIWDLVGELEAAS